jgi:hypothetical protein
MGSGQLFSGGLGELDAFGREELLTTFSDAFESTVATRMVNALEARLSAAGKQTFQAAWVGWTRSGGKGLERVYGRRAGIPRRHR